MNHKVWFSIWTLGRLGVYSNMKIHWFLSYFVTEKQQHSVAPGSSAATSPRFQKSDPMGNEHFSFKSQKYHDIYLSWICVKRSWTCEKAGICCWNSSSWRQSAAQGSGHGWTPLMRQDWQISKRQKSLSCLLSERAHHLYPLYYWSCLLSHLHPTAHGTSGKTRKEHIKSVLLSQCLSQALLSSVTCSQGRRQIQCVGIS